MVVYTIKICDEQPLNLPSGIFIWQDTGFLGHNPENAVVLMPQKKPKGKELSAEEKSLNKNISSIRIGVEHTIGGAKRWRVVKEVYRCRKFGFDHKVMCIAYGLRNFLISLNANAIAI